MKLVNLGKTSEEIKNLLTEEETFGIKDKQKRVKTYSLNTNQTNLKEDVNYTDEYDNMQLV